MTELIWDGKYDKDHHRIAPVRINLPFQTVETVNESGVERANQLDLWAHGQPGEWRNRLIWGDKKYVLPSLLPEFAGKVNLIYIDPPFATGADFSFSAEIPDTDDEFVKEPTMVEQKAYRDTWGRGYDSYYQWFYETSLLLRELLAEDGSIYVHSDWHTNAGLRFILDELFGSDRFINEIIWRRKQAAAWSAKQFGVTNDTLLFYVKGDNYAFNAEYSREDDNTKRYIAERFVYDDGDGRRYMKSPLVNPLPRPNLRYAFHGVNPPKTGWLYSLDRMEEFFQRNELAMPSDGNGRIYRKIYEDTYPGQIVQNIWTDIPIVNPMAAERLNYPTQKPEALLERIINASSNEGDLVLDCFCGSGTTAAVAEKLGRRWIACDLGRFAIHTTRKRLLSIPNVKPFAVQNLGKYERQQWQAAEFAQGDTRQSPETQLAYRRFMLDLYRAQPIEGYTWLHGVRDGRLVHIGGVDAPIAVGDVRAIVKEFWRASGQAGSSGVDILGWDFAFELNEVAKQMAEENNVHLRFKTIPREVLEKRAVEQGDITFFELGALSVKVSQRAAEGISAEERPNGRFATITLTDFLAPYQDVPAEIIAKITHWAQWIDYWAVDWDYQGDAFHNMAQTYRTRKDPRLQLSLSRAYDQPGAYTVVIKVIDILGNDTTKTVTITVQ